ncbi:MAG: acyl-CoA dehydrogenase family protein, partial [Pyrinomonadaceae bacterium]
EEEHKMGIKGSSTCAVIFQDAMVPVENMLGEIGQGAKIAFNILNFGRFKLGATCVGGMKLMLHDSIRYANERRQFGKAISEFGAIKTKLAEMAIRIWVGESAVYRTVGLIQSAITDPADAQVRLRSAEEYAVECSMIKVSLSEFCGFVGDEMVQIYGGYGYSADYPAERAYRDMRINRIFEGTNEINRMLIPGMLMKRAMTGRLGLLPAIKALQDELLSAATFGATATEELLAKETGLMVNAKKVALMILGIAAQKYMQALSDQQEILMNAADIIMDAYLMESAVLRVQKRAQKISTGQQTENNSRVIDMTRVFCFDAISRIEVRAKSTLAAMTEGDEMRTMLAALQRLTKHAPINTVELRHKIAETLIKANTYSF